jgi:hypothetical protein
MIPLMSMIQLTSSVTMSNLIPWKKISRLEKIPMIPRMSMIQLTSLVMMSNLIPQKKDQPSGKYPSDHSDVNDSIELFGNNVVVYPSVIQ